MSRSERVVNLQELDWIELAGERNALFTFFRRADALDFRIDEL